MLSGARPDFKEVIKQAYPTPLGALRLWTRSDQLDSKLQAMTTQLKMPVASVPDTLLPMEIGYTYMKKIIVYVNISTTYPP